MKASWLKNLVIALLALLVIVAAAAWYGQQKISAFAEQPLQTSEPVLVTVKPGQSVYAVVSHWQQQGWLGQDNWLRWLLRQQPQLGAIRAGTYQIPQGVTLTQALNHLVSGDEHQFAITFVEGSQWRDWQQQLRDSQHLTGKQLLAESQALLKALAISQTRPEGLLYPDTYFYTAGTSALDLLKRAKKRMDKVVGQAWSTRHKTVDKHIASPYEALILASIIEKETGHQGERGLISSVFHNRLDKKMRLQTDPTVIYGMGERFDGDIRKADLKESTPYNTYVIKGLPPTPIAMPGRAAIEAALRPEQSDYFYFVSRGDGSHVFSRTLAEHNANVRRYILSRNMSPKE